jgi:hypothetical protein
MNNQPNIELNFMGNAGLEGGHMNNLVELIGAMNVE